MSNKTDFKENSATKALSNSFKRQKMSENLNFSKNVSDSVDESTASVTVYEDDNDLTYFNKSKSHLCNSLLSKRSPLATINKPSNQAGPSQQVSKPVYKFDESFVRRLVPKENLPDPFQFLSEEVLLHIFSFLPKKTLNRIAVVNERFCRVVQDETLWIRMDLGNKLLRRGALSVILCRGFVILRLAQAKIQSPIFEPDFITEGYVSKLQYLDLSIASIDKTSLAQLLRVCRHLKKLSLEALPLDMPVCREISANKALETLNLAMCEGLTTEAVMLMMLTLRNLVALNISWTRLPRAAIEALTCNVPPSIMRLNVAGCRNLLLDKHIKRLGDRCKNIVELDVSDCTVLTKETLEHVKLFPKLEYLSISRCYNIPMTSVLTLNSMTTLKYLDVFGLLTDAGLANLEKAVKSIEVNKFMHSSVARPTVTPRRTSIWGIRTRDQ